MVIEKTKKGFLIYEIDAHDNLFQREYAGISARQAAAFFTDSFARHQAEIANGKNPAAVELGRLGGSVTSDKKAAAVRANGKKGGRPRNKKS